jgi:hypothetical protein
MMLKPRWLLISRVASNQFSPCVVCLRWLYACTTAETEILSAPSHYTRLLRSERRYEQLGGIQVTKFSIQDAIAKNA